MGYSSRVAGRVVRVNADAKGDTPNVPAKRRKFGLGGDAPHGDGDSEGSSTVNAAENSTRDGAVAYRASRRNPLGGRAQTDKPLREPINSSELERIARIGSWSLSPTGAIRWSDEMYRIYGVSPETFVPTVASLLDLIHPADRQALQAWVAACSAGDKCDELEFRTILPDGSIRWISGRGGLKKDSKNRPMYIVGTAQEVTERKRMEQTLSTALDYNRLLIEVCPIGVVVYKATGECVSANEAVAEIVGATVTQLKEQNFREIKSWENSGLLASATQALASGATVKKEVHLNPSTFGRDSWIVARFVAFHYHNERHLLALFVDITEKKRIEELNKVYVAKLETAFMQTLAVVTTLSEMRDPYTAGHERRVAEIAVAIGAELGFEAHEQQGLRVAGYLHDIGKITVPAEILSKPGKLSAAEFALIKEHPRAGYEVLKQVDFPWPVALVALQHHERIDGSGYPQGLKGDEIAREARIVAVADVVEAMASHGPYRPASGIEKALAEIERGRGTVFDAEPADACLRLFRERRYQLPV
jgi:PAS domain S-box-containing protein/putative nucleotidyltransferase with HDIG domain